MYQQTTMPNSNNAEMMILGCMLTNTQYLNIAVTELMETDFYNSEHQIIFLILKEMKKEDKRADIYLVCEELKRKNKLTAAGGIAYIVSLAQYAGTSAYLEEYIEELRRHSARGKLLNFVRELEQKALNDRENPFDIVSDAKEAIVLLEKYRPSKEKFPIRLLNQFEKNFFLTEPPKKPMLLECLSEDQKPLGFLPKGVVAMLAGAGGIGKTHLLFQLAISIATDTPFINKFTPTRWCGEGKKGNVFIGLGENQYEDIHRLLYKSAKRFRDSQPDLLVEASSRIAVFSFCGQQAAFIESKKPSRYFQDLKTRLAEVAPPGGWSLIILDPVSRLLGADAETDNASATQFISLLEELTIEIPGNPTVFFAHHVNKASLSQTTQDQSAARGSSALTDGVRWQMNLAQSTNEKGAPLKDAGVTLKMTKSNFTMIFPEIRLQKDGDGCLISQRASETAKKLF